MRKKDGLYFLYRIERGLALMGLGDMPIHVKVPSCLFQREGMKRERESRKNHRQLHFQLLVVLLLQLDLAAQPRPISMHVE